MPSAKQEASGGFNDRNAILDPDVATNEQPDSSAHSNGGPSRASARADPSAQLAFTDEDGKLNSALDVHTLLSQLVNKMSTVPKTQQGQQPNKRQRTLDGSKPISNYSEDPIAISTLQAFMSHFLKEEDGEGDKPFEDGSTMEQNLDALSSLVDLRSKVFDGHDIDGIFNCPDNPFSFAAGSKNNNDILSQSKMLKADDCNEFFKAQVSELKGLEEADVFDYQEISSFPKDAQLLNAIWSYRRKRRPDGTLLKYKSRICADGSMQQYGVDYWETYAPVVHWSTVRLILVLSAMLGLKSRQIDYTQAFPQANLSDPVYMKIPQGWKVDKETNKLVQSSDPSFFDRRHFIKLKKNLYGCKQAGRNWYLHLKEGLLSRGFKQSNLDPCLFISENCLLVLYTDDCCIFAHDDKTIDDLRKSLEDDFLLKDEGDIQDFLGIRLSSSVENGQVTINMVQTGLIDQILEDVGLTTKSNVKHVPANAVLQPNPNAPRFEATWNYRSVIGKLNFLAQNTRPDISMAVHQCARYVNNPNSSHMEAVKYLCRYLLQTRTRGLILRPNGNTSLDAYVDSDFAGTWSTSTSSMRQSCLSRTGYVITYGGCPIHWASKLQSEIALSTTEAEYIALSMCARELIPLRSVLNDIAKRFKIPEFAGSLASPMSKTFSKTYRSIVYEDNAGCLEIAMNPEQYRPRTKHIGIKWHHFRDQIASGALEIQKIDTTQNWADIFTKPLPRTQFEFLRKQMMGW